MSFELDHVFVAARFEAPEMKLLREAGFLEGPAHDHPGQGTASRGIFFENAYLELIWLTDATAAAARAVSRTGLAQRSDPRQEACPFGFGLRSTLDPVPRPPFATWEYSPPYLPEGTSFPMAASSEKLDEPLIFVLPWARSPSWEVPDHPNGARRLTAVTFGPRVSKPSEVLTSFLGLGLARCADSDAPLLQVELDQHRQEHDRDFRPDLPLTIHW
jgi:hypothetical protein